jgi:glycosyltransferase involved in cell wall biosynthesis
MTIAAHVNTGKGFHQDVLLDQLIFLANRNPADHIIIFASDSSWYSKSLPLNITPVVIRPAIKNNLLSYYWYNYRLPGLLERYNTDVFISNASTLSLKTKRPQFLYFNNAGFATDNTRKDSNASQKQLSRFVEISQAVLVTEDYAGLLFRRSFSFAENKCRVIYHGINQEYKPLNYLQKLAAVTRISGDSEYFLVPVSPATVSQLTIILKAFSIFKKWQKSSMKLVLLLFRMPEKDLIPNFQQYKHRNDVKIIHAKGSEENILAMGGAYAVIYMPASLSPEPFGLNALSAGVPIISADNEYARSLYNNAALYCQVDEQSLAEQLQRLYKDENLKTRLVQNAVAQTVKYDLEKSSLDLYDSITNKTGP